jgi:hypothetical protein
MKIRVVSDVHTEFMARDMHKIDKIVLHDVLPPLPDDASTTLVLCGDIGSMHKPKCLEAFLGHVAGRFEEVLYIPGNHEPYGGEITTYLDIIQTMTTQWKNVTASDKLVCGFPKEDGDYLDMVGCTLWTDMGNMGRYGTGPHVSRDEGCIFECGRGMNDYRVIGNGKPHPNDWPIEVSHTLAINVEHQAHLEEHVTEGSVVFTHHAPSFKSVHEKYVGNIMNGAYANNLDDFILEREPKLWLHGHMHDPVDYMIGKTRVLSNPMGYPGERGVSGYRKDLVLEI